MPYKTKSERKKYYESHKEEINKKRREYSKRPEVRKRISKQDKEWRVNHRDYVYEYNHKYFTDKVKQEKELVLKNYGMVCACCGESNPIFLSIDHINGGGEKHRKEIGRKINRWLVKNNFPTGFQLLCYNCNCGRNLNGGICPHKEKSNS